ncbi:hypothetical protein [Streptomyces sp. NBC_00304]|nr:hypothetical protein [Streptomyces sp. NBC_00304]
MSTAKWPRPAGTTLPWASTETTASGGGTAGRVAAGGPAHDMFP